MLPKSLKPCFQTCLPSEKAGVCDLKTFPQNLTFSPISLLLTVWPWASLQPLRASTLPSVKRGRYKWPSRVCTSERGKAGEHSPSREAAMLVFGKLLKAG